MAVKLRLRRLGRTHSPFYHIVAADSRSPRDGKYIEQVGSYNPIANPAIVELDHAKTMTWLKNGAQPTETVRSILSHEGIMLKLHLHRKGKSEAEIQAEFERWAAQKQAQKDAAKSKADAAKRSKHQQRTDAEKAKRSAIAERVAAKSKVAEAAPAVEAVAEATEAPATEEQA